MSNTPTVSVPEIEDLPLRSLFAREDRDFTPWLVEPANLARLSRTLGFEMELTATEASTGSFRTDVLATRSQDGVAVVIENQFGRSDHDHFGKSLTYLAAHQASVVVWIAESFADEHRASLTWLNEHTEDEFEFWAVIPRVLKIGDSPPGLRFEVAIAPNRLVREVRKIDRRVDESVARTRKGFWEMFMPLVKSDPVLSKCGVRYGGRLGFLWLFPEDMGDIADADPHVARVHVASGAVKAGMRNLLPGRRGRQGRGANGSRVRLGRGAASAKWCEPRGDRRSHGERVWRLYRRGDDAGGGTLGHRARSNLCARAV